MTIKSVAVRVARAALSPMMRRGGAGARPIIVAPPESRALLAPRIDFYLEGAAPEFQAALSVPTYFSGSPLGYMGPRRLAIRARPEGFHLDPLENPADGADWALFAGACARHVPDLVGARQRFGAFLAAIRKRGCSRTYVFGTGPSLSKVRERDWQDGYRIVCNTIVRDADTWNYLQPDLMVAGDAIYHFGYTEFAKAFRRDLLARMLERPVPFIYPALFDVLVQREFGAVAKWLIPVPIAPAQRTIRTSMENEFSLPDLGNVLNLLLLPVATTLTKEVGMWGFDGRAPKDQGFWSNSGLHSYPELMHTLHEAHPAFFRQHVPDGRESRYVEAVFGDPLERNLAWLERRGWTFRMLHPSFTPVLAKRYSPPDQPVK